MTSLPYAVVTSISSCYKEGGVPYRVIRVWRAEDVMTVQPGGP